MWNTDYIGGCITVIPRTASLVRQLGWHFAQMTCHLHFTDDSDPTIVQVAVVRVSTARATTYVQNDIIAGESEALFKNMGHRGERCTPLRISTLFHRVGR